MTVDGLFWIACAIMFFEIFSSLIWWHCLTCCWGVMVKWKSNWSRVVAKVMWFIRLSIGIIQIKYFSLIRIIDKRNTCSAFLNLYFEIFCCTFFARLYWYIELIAFNCYNHAVFYMVNLLNCKNVHSVLW